MKQAVSDLRTGIDSSTLSATGFLAILLVVGLVAVVPAVAVTLGGTVAGKLPVMLAVLAAVGGVYLIVAYVLDSLRLGVYIAVFVLSTFAANIPLASDQYFRFAPGYLGPQIWLVQGPLALLVAWLAYDGAFTRDSLTRTELLFGGFVFWSVLSAVFGGGPRPDTALFFSWLQFQALLVFMVVRRGVERDIVRLSSTVLAYAVAVAGHIAFSAAQLWTQNSIGVSYLGEGISWNAVTYGLLSVDNIVIVSGLTGHGYVLVVLILLTFPGMLWLANYVGGRLGMVGLVGAVTAAIALRLTTSDAGRGAFLVLVTVLLAGFVLLLKSRTDNDVPGFDNYHRSVGMRRALPYALTLALSVAVILFPSSKSGATSDTSLDVDSKTTPSGNETASTSTSAPGTISSDGSLSVPLFDLTNLGVRFQQYVVGADIFRRNPIFGVGGGNYPYVAQAYRVPNKMNIPIPNTLHNIYLLLLAETGLPGFVLYFTTIAFVFWTGIQSVLGGRQSHLHLSVLVGLVSYLAFGFFAHPIDKLTALFPFWALSGALIGASRVSWQYEERAEDIDDSRDTAEQ